MHFSSAAFFLSLASSTSAGWASMQTCSTGDDPRSRWASTSLISVQVIYSNELDGCTGVNTFWAKTGVTNPLWALREFDGKDGFSANIDIVSRTPGLKVKVDDEEVALGDATGSWSHTGSEAKEKCKALGMGEYDGVRFDGSYWAYVPKTKCK
ncbi:hypothetical protein CkaCkLH20_04250 [Colletotrichum karsti]|uniref:Ecp2 effector protein domain-containing protein n=1 Tax=Colletotrichum karsti TaxID=1095194 RepID=A0A9P6I9G2_9PEZI|nr:uncharacterized protein CkaCkLH20_04250 [Colletotrichum karsti]KAF9878212.1 hypothetical protein CkaCkLH20_04250 [Colletotrichum karsti]